MADSKKIPQNRVDPNDNGASSTEVGRLVAQSGSWLNDTTGTRVYKKQVGS